MTTVLAVDHCARLLRIDIFGVLSGTLQGLGSNVAQSCRLLEVLELEALGGVWEALEGCWRRLGGQEEPRQRQDGLRTRQE